MSEWVTCPNCEGKGTKELNTECRSCAGKGIINQATGLPPAETQTYIPIVIDQEPYCPNEQWVPPWHPSKAPYCNPYPIVTSVESR